MSKIPLTRKVLPSRTIFSSREGLNVCCCNSLQLGTLPLATDPGLAPALWQGETAKYLRAHKIDHVVLPMWQAERYPIFANFMYRLGLLDAPGLKLVPLAYAETLGDSSGPAMRFIGPSSPRQRLYRIEWTAEAGPP